MYITDDARDLLMQPVGADIQLNTAGPSPDPGRWMPACPKERHARLPIG
jgi:hypothetical protein